LDSLLQSNVNHNVKGKQYLMMSYLLLFLGLEPYLLSVLNAQNNNAIINKNIIYIETRVA